MWQYVVIGKLPRSVKGGCVASLDSWLVSNADNKIGLFLASSIRSSLVLIRLSIFRVLIWRFVVDLLCRLSCNKSTRNRSQWNTGFIDYTDIACQYSEHVIQYRVLRLWTVDQSISVIYRAPALCSCQAPPSCEKSPATKSPPLVKRVLSKIQCAAIKRLP